MYSCDMYYIDLKNIKLEGDFKDHLAQAVLNKACTLCLFIKVSTWLMCLLMHFFGIFSIKRLQEALKFIFMLIVALILVSGRQLFMFWSCLLCWGICAWCYLTPTFYVWVTQGIPFSENHSHFVLKYVLKLGFTLFVRVNFNSFHSLS